MIKKEKIHEIQELVQDFWNEEVRRPENFIARAEGKEIGHKIADLVDEKTTNLLQGKYKTNFEHGSTGKNRSRSMGDVWVEFDGVHYPINIKTGEANKNGQPNMVAMTKLLKSLVSCEISSYYLLIIKFEIPTTEASNSIIPHVFFVDMLDYLDYMTFDSGPGQIMMRESEFYNAVNSAKQPPLLSSEDKIAKLMKMYEDGNERLFKNREKTTEILQQAYKDYQNQQAHPLDQSSLKLQPRNLQ